MSFLVTAASGAIGKLVTQQLSAAGFDVHTLTRKPLPGPRIQGVRAFTGDLTAAQFDPALFAGVKGLFLFPAPGNMDAFLQAARHNGVEHVVLLSSLAAAQEFARDQNSASALHHLAAESAVRRSEMQFTFLRPGTFANNLRQWAPSIKKMGVVFGPYPESSQAPIHEADIADVVVTCLTQNTHRGQVYPLTGPQALTQIQQLKTIGDALGRPLVYKQTTPEQFRDSMRAYMGEDIIHMLLSYWSDTSKVPDRVHSTVEKLLGRPGRTLAQWAQDHVKDFSQDA